MGGTRSAEPATKVEVHAFAWFGDRPMTLDFPPSWHIEMVGNADIPSLCREEMKERIRNPIGSPTLSELASNKRRLAVIVDDITRPTPVAEILPILLEAFEEAGATRDSVTVIIGGGTHAAASEEEIEKKIGRELARAVKVVPHDPGKDLVHLGTSTRGTPIHVNRSAFESDLVVGVGCIYPHPAAGFSGGSKIVAPGICGSETARHIHDYLGGCERGKIFEDSELRKEMEEIASKVGLEFIVNVVLNQRREVGGLFAGDRVLAHREGVRFATEMYSVEPVKEADVVIIDVYPFDMTFQFAHDRSLWQLDGLKNNVSKVVLASCPAGLGSHDLYPLKNALITRAGRRLRNLQWKEFRNPRGKVRALMKILGRRKQELIFLSEGLSAREIRAIYPNARVFRTWNEVLKELEHRHGRRAVKVGFYRCSPYLLPVPNELRSG